MLAITHRDGQTGHSGDMMTTDSTNGGYFARWLDLTMENRGISGASLAKRLRVTDAAVSRWRNGAGVPRLDTVMKLAKVLSVEPLRLAVTAGHMEGSAIGVAALPLPEPTERRAKTKRALAKIPGLTAEERQHLINAYDERFSK
jgi:transcriptional regulator with XRE-family HTH domain